MTESTHKKSILGFLLLVYLAVVIRSAWLSDDCYITFRTVENFLHGYGLVYNLGERVQSFTHPLWLFTITLFYAISNLFHHFFISGRLAWVALIVSIAFSFIAVAILWLKIARDEYGAYLAAVILIFSKSFIDYSTSGLEEPLTNLLLVLFFWRYLSLNPIERTLPKNVRLLALIASLGALNRLDTILFYLPALVMILFAARNKFKVIGNLAIGFLPLLAWELFSVFYYGFLFPNTAFAKLNNGIPQGHLFWQGLVYYLDSFNLDMITLFSIVMTLGLLIVTKSWNLLPVQIGIFLYCFYVAYIGGDFMSGRFFAAPLLLSVILLTQFPLQNRTKMGLTAMFLGLGLFSGANSLANNATYFRERVSETGIADERGWYFRNLGLINFSRARSFPDYPWNELAWQRYNDNFKVEVMTEIGRSGYVVGPYVHVVDRLALSDSLLAHLPPKEKENWRIGHIEREIPEGYILSLETGQNKLSDPNLAMYYEKLAYIIKGELFDWNRLVEIWNFNTGKYDNFLKAYVDSQRSTP